MEIIPLLLKEFNQEAAITRKFMNLVPFDKLDWQPHPKSMTMKSLVVHIAELPAWVDMAISTNGIDFAEAPYEPTVISDQQELLNVFEESVEKGATALQNINEDVLIEPWILRNGDQVLAEMTRYETIRHSFSQTTHHRAQLGVYLRLLDIPIPGSYGPSADEMWA
jgi:uncharacterized damage-inducible protein DinB